MHKLFANVRPGTCLFLVWTCYVYYYYYYCFLLPVLWVNKVVYILVTVAVVGSQTLQYVDESASLRPHSDYMYRVTAETSAGQTVSGWSNVTTRSASQYNTRLFSCAPAMLQPAIVIGSVCKVK